EGFHCYGPGEKSVKVAPYQDWWYDEYAVDLATGQSSPSVQHTGWLGQALGPAYNFVWASTAPDAITNTSFGTDRTTGWSCHQFAPASATLTRDATTAAVGAASARVHVATPGIAEWHVYLNSVGKLSVLAGNSYSATFRCKASEPRDVHVLAGNSGGEARIRVDTSCRQHQPLTPPS